MAKYGSDLHHLESWSKRILDHAEKGGEPNQYWPLIFRDDRDAADAMLRLGIDHAEPIRQIREHLAYVEGHYERWLRQPNSANAESVYSSMYDLGKRIAGAAAVLGDSNKQRPEPVENPDDNLSTADRAIACIRDARGEWINAAAIGQKICRKPSTVRSAMARSKAIKKLPIESCTTGENLGYRWTE